MWLEKLSQLFVPLVFAAVGIVMLFSKKDLFSEFTSGAKNGLETAVRLLPTLAALLAAIAMFNASGAAEKMVELLTPLGEKVGLPSEILPFILVRPLSGGASTAMVADVYEKYGPDSFAGRCVSVIAGASDTLLYVVSVYFGAVGVKKTRGTVPAAFMAMVFCIFFGVFLCRLFF